MRPFLSQHGALPMALISKRLDNSEVLYGLFFEVTVVNWFAKEEEGERNRKKIFGGN